ncbi:hypothetical protein Droror1_Dr00009518 [Drosera rotundifolia]
MIHLPCVRLVRKPLASLLTLISSFKGEMGFTVLSNLITICKKVERIVSDAAPNLISNVNLLFINLFLHPIEKLGLEQRQGESHLDAMLRGELLNALVLLGHDSTIDEVTRRFQAFLDDRSTQQFPPDIREVDYESSPEYL